MASAAAGPTAVATPGFHAAGPEHSGWEVEGLRDGSAAAFQQAGTTIEAEGLRLVRHGDGIYELSAEGVHLEELIGHLASVSGVEYSVAPELLHVAVTIETAPVTLSKLLEQLRVTANANLIVATTREHAVSRVWLTAMTPAMTTGVAAPAAGATTTTASPLPAMEPPADGRPRPLGNELRAAGYDPSVDAAAYINQQAAAQRAASEATADPGSAGAPGAGQPEAGQGAAGEAETQNRPPVPMEPNALEKYFAGDSSTKTYHRLNCFQAMYLPSVNKVWFTTRQEAIAAGYTPHEICVGR